MPSRHDYVKVAFLLAAACSNLAHSADGRLSPVRTEGPLTYYEGTVTIHGKVERRTDPTWLELMGDVICLEAQGKSRTLIPRSANDSRSTWFCFDDHKMALKLLNLPSAPAKGTCGYYAPATVRVTNYVVNREESEVTDTARLATVITRGPIRSIKCE